MVSAYRRVVLWGPPILYAMVIFHFSSESNPLPALTALAWDKALHAIEYAGLALLLCRAVRGEGATWWLSMTLALILAGAYAASDEWHQTFVPERDADILDWVADAIGAVVGSAGYRPIESAINRHVERRQA